MSRWWRPRRGQQRTMFDGWYYLGLDRLLDTIEGHIRLLIVLLILCVLVSVVLFGVSLVLAVR